MAAGTDRPFRTGDHVDLRRYWRTEEFRAMHGFNGGKFALGAGLHLTSRVNVFLGIHRSGSEFSDREFEDMALLQSVVAAAYRYRSALESIEALATSPAPETADQRSAAARHRPTPREADVLNLLSSGCTNVQIATRLGITERTVRKHLAAVFEKAGVCSRTSAALWWSGR
jgi:DNA-binding CsgD family transcriptional regulator